LPSLATVTGDFSVLDASWRFVWAVVGGIAIGLAVGFVVAEVRRRIDNPPVEVTLSLMTGYFAFIPATAAGASGVIAVVTAGVYLGWRTPELTSVEDSAAGRGAVEHRRLRPERARLRARRLTALEHPRQAEGPVCGGADLVGGARHRHGDPHEGSSGCRSSPGETATKPFTHTFLISWAGCAAPSRSPPRSRCPWRPTRARRFRTAT
jgi:hypothetical protein